MESFDYLSVLLSIILGLAITQVLLGFRGLILTRQKVKLYLPTVIWAGSRSSLPFRRGWASFGLRMRANWTFSRLHRHRATGDQRVHGHGGSPPGHQRDSIIDLRDHYFAHKSWFFGFMLAGVVFSAAKEFALNGHLPGRLNGEFHVIFGLAALVAAITRREWVHKLMAPAFALLFLLYIALLFGRL